ncbi:MULTISPECIES: hypothetical protein [unclassified Sphingopyxis]|uniref:hypothetical protein n=1 Tax=unclassified Sphingopyxis TaxID=2614943 RepID=UPI0007363D43|nr:MULTISPECIES: hypothetical protein [unclassified Sphingopyxis]KTE50973.1 hypothetical protein ATE69_17345 [Sphingopyxis sp. H071]
MTPSAFYAAWTPTLLFAGAVNKASPADVMIVAGGFEWPVVTLALAAIGVLAARPLAPKRNPPMGLAKNILVTVIMLVAALLWVLDSRPGLLFAFVVSIGLGFSGYTVIELLGEEIAAYIRRAIGALPLPGLKAGQTTKPDQEPS